MVEKTFTEETSPKSECQKYLPLYMSSMHNFHDGIVDTYLPMMNDIVFSKIGKHVSSAIPLTQIYIFQVLGLVLFYNTYLVLAE